MTRTKWIIVVVCGGGLFIACACLIVGMIALRPQSAPPIAEVEVVTAPPEPASRLTRTTDSQATPKAGGNSTLVIQTQPDVVLKDQRCIGKENDMTCVFTAQNVTSAVVGSAYFDIAVFDPQGTTLRSTFIAFNSLFPGEIRKQLTHIGAPANTHLGKYTVGPARVSSLGNAGGLTTNPFVVVSADFTPGNYSDSVVTVISNTSSKTIDSAEITAVLYAKDGSFVGGGDTFAPTMLPNGKARIEIRVEHIGSVSKVEVYPAVTLITSIK